MGKNRKITYIIGVIALVAVVGLSFLGQSDLFQGYLRSFTYVKPTYVKPTYEAIEPSPEPLSRYVAPIKREALVVEPTACVAAPSGMISWWPAEGSGVDIIGINNLTLKNGATFTSGKVGQAFSFDGVDDYAEVGPQSVSSVTVDAWVKVGNEPGQVPIVSHGALAPFKGYLLGVASDDSVFFSIGSKDVVFSQKKITRGKYHHIAATYDKTTGKARIYLDGDSYLDIIGTNLLNPSSTHLRIAAKTNASDQATPSTVPVEVDELEVFDRALSAQEIKSIFNAGSGGKCKPEVTRRLR